RLYAFTWRRFQKLGDTDLQAKAASDFSDCDAAARQAVDIIRRRGDRGLGGVNVYPSSPPPGWIPHIYYTHLVLQDYLNARLPDAQVICPKDKYRLMWQRYAKNWPGDAFPV